MASLRQEQREENVADGFILEWKTPQYKDKVLVLVEGYNDYLFYYKFFDPSTSEIRTSQGCSKLKEIHARLLSNQSITNITIKDSDFERLNGSLFADEGFFYTDAHDYEMMCIKNEQTQKELMENLAIEYSADVYSDILMELEYLSYFKWYNYKHHLNYNFKAFNVTSLNREQLNSFNYIHSDIQPKSPSLRRPISEEELDNFKMTNDCCNIYELTCGHDFMKRFCFYLKQNYSKNENEDTLKRIMHPCFRMDAFNQTQLYHSIETWSSEHYINILSN